MSTPNRALLVIDVQNEYFTGGLRIDYPDPQLSLQNIGRAMDAARVAGIPVLVVQHTAPPGAPIFQKGSAAWALHEVVASRAHDHYVEKTRPSVFAGTDVQDWLTSRAIDTLAVVGYMTQNCNASTIYQAMHAGYQVEMLHDATGAVPYANEAGSATAEEIHRVFSVVFHSNFAAVTSTAHWIGALREGAAIARSSVPASYAGAACQA